MERSLGKAAPAGAVESLLPQLRRRLETAPDSPAFMIMSGDRYLSIPWRQFMRDVDAVSIAMRNRYGRGSAIALLGENSYEWMVCHASCLFAGIAVVPLDVSLDPSEIAMRIAFAGVKAVIFSAQNRAKIRETMRLVPGGSVQYIGFGSLEADRVVVEGRKALKSGGKSLLDEDRDPGETASIVFTSGTTAQPRGVELSLLNMSAFPASAARVLPAEEGWRSLMALPLYHIFGIASTYFLLVRGVALGVCADFRRLYESVNRFRVHCLFLVPALADVLAQKTFARRACASNRGFAADADDSAPPLKWILTGGAPLPRRTFENLQALGVKVLEGYGLTETASLFSLAPYADPRPGTAGLASPLCETAVSPDGELMIRGPGVMKGYFRDPEGTARVLSTDGWLATGDTGSISPDGYVTVTGRRNRSIVLSSGKKVAPEELETRISALPGVLETVVYGDMSTRVITAEIYASVPEDLVREQIAMMNTMLPIYKRVRNLVFRDRPFERTASGKIRMRKAPAE